MLRGDICVSKLPANLLLLPGCILYRLFISASAKARSFLCADLTFTRAGGSLQANQRRHCPCSSLLHVVRIHVTRTFFLVPLLRLLHCHCHHRSLIRPFFSRFSASSSLSLGSSLSRSASAAASGGKAIPVARRSDARAAAAALS